MLGAAVDHHLVPFADLSEMVTRVTGHGRLEGFAVTWCDTHEDATKALPEQRSPVIQPLVIREQAFDVDGAPGINAEA